jgi:hypothetical protein
MAVAAVLGMLAGVAAVPAVAAAGIAAGADELALILNAPAPSGVARGYTTQLSGTIRYAGPTSTGQVVGATVRITTNQANTVVRIFVGTVPTACAGPATTLTCALPAISRGAGSTSFFTEVQAKTLGSMTVTATVEPPTPDNAADNTMTRYLSVLDGPQWKSPMSFRPPASVQQNLLSRPRPYQCLNFQKIEDGYSKELTWDYYAVAIDRLPKPPGSSFPYLPGTFFNYIRTHLTWGSAGDGWSGSLVDPKQATFQPMSRRYATSYYLADPARDDNWFTGAPQNSVLALNLGNGLDQAAVVTAQYSNTSTSRSWTFYTLFGTCQASVIGYHPVSGVRQFGLNLVGVGEDATYIFWTRGADQISNLGHWALRDSVYAGGHNTWLSLQARVNAFVNGNGGLSTIIGHTVGRVDWYPVCYEYWRPTLAWVDEPGVPIRDENKCAGGG